ncbi:hypothetical protein BGZ72_004724 [Mortierella alpina]|nr:hypothetical protein BGZ72_004724 [Mortierella alpina]
MSFDILRDQPAADILRAREMQQQAERIQAEADRVQAKRLHQAQIAAELSGVRPDIYGRWGYNPLAINPLGFNPSYINPLAVNPLGYNPLVDYDGIYPYGRQILSRPARQQTVITTSEGGWRKTLLSHNFEPTYADALGPYLDCVTDNALLGARPTDADVDVRCQDPAINIVRFLRAAHPTSVDSFMAALQPVV